MKYIKTAPIRKSDRGVRIQLENYENIPLIEVSFSPKSSGQMMFREPDQAGQVEIPNELVFDNKTGKVFVSVCAWIGATAQKKLAKIEIPIKAGD